MIKKAAITIGVFALSAVAAGSIAFAQTATPTTSPTVQVPTPTFACLGTNCPSPTSVMTPTPMSAKTLPNGAPATGRGN